MTRKLKQYIVKSIFGEVYTTVGKCKHGRSIGLYRPLRSLEPATDYLHKQLPQTRAQYVVEYYGFGKSNILTIGFNTYQSALKAINYLETNDNGFAEIDTNKALDRKLKGRMFTAEFAAIIEAERSDKRINAANAAIANQKHMEFLSSIEGYADLYINCK